VTTRVLTFVSLAGAALVVCALVAVGAATAIGRGLGTEAVSATFDAHAIGDPGIKSCRDLGGGTYLKFEGNYAGRLTTDSGEELALELRGFEVLVNRETGLGSVEGTWQLQAPPEPDVVGRGELLGVFVGDPHIIGDPHLIGDPSIFAGEVHGMMVGGIEDPDERRALWNFSASLRDGSTQTGAIGDPHIAPNPAVLIPPGPC
jgi:hypothetical protein